MATGRSRKKNKFKFNERSSSSVRDKYSNDPAFTEDVRHLALPLRRNSNEARADEFAKMFGSKKKSKSKDDSNHYSLRMERKKKQSVPNNHSAEYLCRNTSSSESLENIIKGGGGQKGISLDRSFENDAKPQMKPKRSSWFLRDKNREKQSSKNDKFFKRASLDFALTFDTKQGADSSKPRSRAKTIYRQNAADYTGDSSTTPQEEIPDPIKKLTKFQIGKRFLKGEIGIRSFNYYLLKEGLKKTGSVTKSKPEKIPFMSKSEENIYEEIFFHQDKAQKPQTPQLPPNLPPPNKLHVNKQPEEGNCLKCDICLQEAAQLQNCDNCVGGNHQQQVPTILAEGYATVRKLDNATIYDFFHQQQQSGGILQFQSYNPNNPNVYKIETTPVAFSEYNLTIEEQLYQQHYAALMALQQQQQQQQQQHYSGDGKIMAKSSSSSDSIRQRQQDNMANEFYTRPNYIYPTNNAEQNQSCMRRDKNNSIYKTDSSNSLRSENSLNKNNSQKSNHNEVQMRQDMSDSSLGDSLFSSDANKRYFGSSESCRFNYECRDRRCSFEENEKCSFSDTCNLRNCDCSSSYFSSDFDDTNNVYGHTGNNVRAIKANHSENIQDTTKSHYADDFIKHVNNVKRRSQNTPYDGGNNNNNNSNVLIYEVPKANPKRLDRCVNDENKLKTTGTVPKLSISSNESRKSNSQCHRHPFTDVSRCQVSNVENNEVSPGSADNNLPLFEASALSNLEKKSTVVENIKKQLPSGNKVVVSSEQDTVQKTAQLAKTENPPKIVVAADDNDDDEVFISHATIVGASVMSMNKDKKKSEKSHANTLEIAEKQPEIKSNDGNNKPAENPTLSSVNKIVCSPLKSPSKAPKVNIDEAMKAQPASGENNNKNITNVNDDKKKLEEANDCSNDDDDDSVFLKTETTAKHKTDVSSVKSNHMKTLNATLTQESATQNLISRESNVQSETVASRDNQKSSKEKSSRKENDKKSKQQVKQQPSNEEQLDFNNIPLPDIPSKKSSSSKHLNKGGKSLSKDNLLPTSTAAKIQSKWKQLTEKEYFKKMHYRNSSFEKKPTYLFGENAKQSQQQPKDGIFLTRSGWLSTSSQRLEKEAEARKENINKIKKANSKIEELISRSESRRPLGATSKDENVTILKIDPQSDRPAYLPVKTNLPRDGPPPPTPILSPPPAFQDHQIRNQIYEIKNGTRIQLSVTDDSDNKTPTPAAIGKGMVFSRSFEYDNRKSVEYSENFSRSFDFDFQMRELEKKQPINKNLLSRYGQSMPFAKLTGISPNYLTKKETNEIVINPNATIFPKVIPGNKVKMNNPNYYNPNSLDEQGRRQQFPRTGMQQNKYRNSLETGSSAINNRLNSCDSGARSDFSNDDLDDEDEEEEDPSSSLALSYKSAAPTSYHEPMKNNRNVTKTLVNQQQQQQTTFKKARSMTPDTSFDDYDLLTVDRNNSKRQRSLTPDKRPITPELIYKGSKLTSTSQTSLMSRQSSGSRNSTLERQLKRYEDGRISRSSSSSSDAENNNSTRRQTRPPFKTAFGDYRIRRSRSLQLSERSPNRSSMLQKLVVRIGNTATPQSVASTPQAPASNQKYREKVDYVHARSKTTLNMPSKYTAQSLRNSDNSLPSSTQTKSFDLLDYNGKSNVDYEFESDSKSKSFDDDFCYNTKVTRNSGNGNPRNNVFSGNRAFSQDRVLLVPPTNNSSASKSLRNSPRNYGSRLYDHDVIYDRNAMMRSPIMNFNRALPLSRERSPVGGRRSRDKDRDYKKPQGGSNNFLKPRTTNTPNRSPNRSPSDSDDSINGNVKKVLKDKSLVSEYLFGLKRKQQANSMNRSSGTASSGSFTSSSSCEFWPHNNNSKSGGKKYPNCNKVCVNNDSDSSGNNVKISVNMQKQRQHAFRSGSVGTTIKVNGNVLSGNGALINKPNNSSIIFLGDCEMPITKSGRVPEHNKTSGSDSSDKKFTQKIQIGGELKQQFAASSQQPRAQNYTRGKFFTPSFSSSCGGISIKRRQLFTRLQSRSLPRSFLRRRNLSSDTNELSSMFPLHSPLQMRAVSSPSLTENPLENKSSISTSPKFTAKPEPNRHLPTNELNDRGQNQTTSSGVLQKFKKTFSHFKNGKTTVSVGDESNDSKHHRFGPLVWRTSKERRKTKTHRRDKCNSGDSGIQVELENDENLSESVQIQQMDISPKLNNCNAKVRRANSAKVSNVTIKSTRNNNNLKQSSQTKRSLSQPSDLDVIFCENKMMNNLDNIKHIDDDDASDSDSLSSNHEIDEDTRQQQQQQQGVVYAEVLYRFDAGGPQELSLEKGTLVEVIKRESGPWWWGRIKYDAVINDNEIEMNQGWFPKDFVKVIPTYGTNRKIIHQQASNSNDCDIIHPPTSAAPTISSSHSSSEIMKDNVIKELLETEINYVKLLNSLVNGFMAEMKERPEVFSPDSLSLMFSNIDQIYRFQQNFLEALRIAIPKGRIADVFLDFQSAFMCYSQYCNSYPRALMELENFNGNKEAAAILESCRIAQNLPELPLSAHLLAPIQRICRYPLHLSELVKHSKTRKEILLKLDVHQLSKPNLETSDFKEMYDVALNAMKRVTEMVNEGKRHSEYLSRMQSRIENFQGPSINIHSTRLFLQTDAIRVSPNLWNNTYTLFLFDRQLIYCKKDLLKRTSYIYKGRIFLDNCRILNLPDGRMFGVNLKNALRMFCETRGKWFDFCFRSSSSKTRFLNTLSAERQFCGSSLFVSEIASGLEEDNLSDCDANTQDYDERGIDVDGSSQLQTLVGNVTTNGSPSLESPMKQQKFSDSLPKKSRKLSKEVPSQIIIDYNPSATSSSANRRRLGNWFRKSKSTNSTPSQSPTHHPLVATATVPSIVNHSDSNSSSQQSSPINYPRQKFKDASSVGGSS